MRYRSWRARLLRRAKTVPALVAGAVLLTVAIPLWLPVATIVDLARLRFRLPTVRLLAFGVAWTWIETAGVLASFATWAVGKAKDPTTQYATMRWWCEALMGAMRVTTGIRPRLEGAEALEGGNAVVLSRHASLADSLLSAWAIRGRADLRPRYVLKRELLLDPCLDIVGLRVPNCFVDRDAPDGAAELDAVAALGATVGPGSVAVIFPEGTRSNTEKRRRALEKIAERDPDRAARLGELRHLLPPRPGGSTALVTGAAGADLVLAWHTGFDGLDSFGGILRKLARPLPPVRFVVRRVPRAEVPSGERFVDWLDEQWCKLDAEVGAALGATR